MWKIKDPVAAQQKVWLTCDKCNAAAACSYSRWFWVSFAGILQAWNITGTVLDYKEKDIQYTLKIVYNRPHINCQENVKIVWHTQGPQSLRIPNSHICLKIHDNNMLLYIFNNSYKIPYDLSEDIQL